MRGLLGRRLSPRLCIAVYAVLGWTCGVAVAWVFY